MDMSVSEGNDDSLYCYIIS